MVQVSQCTALGAGREIGSQPLLLQRARCVRHVAVQGDDVPIAEVVAIVALRWIAGRRAEVPEIAGGSGSAVLVVARNRPGPSFLPAPRRSVAVRVVGARTVGVRVVAGDEHRAGDGVEQVRREGIPVQAAVGDISGPNKYGTACGDDLDDRGIRPREALIVRDRGAYGIQAHRRVHMPCGDRRSRARRSPTGRRAVAPRDRVGPRGSVGTPIGERGSEAQHVARVRREVGARVHGRRSSDASATPGIRERLAGNGDELPGIRPVSQREPQHAGDSGSSHLAVRLGRRDGARPHPARAHRELPDPPLRIEHPGRTLRREALVQLVVRVEHERGAGGVEIVPERLDLGAHGCPRRAEAGEVPDGEDALLGVRGQVGLEPLLLRRPRGRRGDVPVAVQHDDVPGTEIVAVVALAAVARGSAPVVVVSRVAGGPRLRVSRGGPGTGLVTTPGRGGGIAIGEVGGLRARTEHIVADGEDGARNGIQNRRGRLVRGAVAARDVPRAHECDRRPGRRAQLGPGELSRGREGGALLGFLGFAARRGQRADQEDRSGCVDAGEVQRKQGHGGSQRMLRARNDIR